MAIQSRHGADSAGDEDVETGLPLIRVSHYGSVAGVAANSIVKLNIGGASYRIRTRSVDKFAPTSLLGRFIHMDHEHRRSWADWYFEESDEYFFERVPRYFDPIYDFFVTGKVHVPKDLCFDKFMAELRYWAVPKSKLDKCCSPFAQFKLSVRSAPELAEKDQFIGLRSSGVRRRLWLVFEGHSKSVWRKVFEFTSTFFVCLSILALVLGSIPELQVSRYKKEDQFALPFSNGNLSELVEHPLFDYIENVCVVYFVLEYAVRFWVAPKKLPFVRDFLNIIDLSAIMPFLFEQLLRMVGLSGDKVRRVYWAFMTVRLLRVLRVVRIAKLGRFSPGLANFALTLRHSKSQMQMVTVIIMTVIVFFSTLVYFLEKDDLHTQFTSIPASFWWCIVTMTTVGYGDIVPVTIAGKIVGAISIVCGVLVLALPITIMVKNFMQIVKLKDNQDVNKYEHVNM